MIPLSPELTCVSISDDSKYALINQPPNVSFILDPPCDTMQLDSEAEVGWHMKLIQ
jgi:hypothetical protein